jgi:hypothetical protein
MHCPFDGPLPPDTLDQYDAHRSAPYLIRYYASVSNPRASVLTNCIFDTLIGRINWPRGSLRRVTTIAKNHGHLASGALPEFLRETECDDDDIDLRVTPINKVDAKLAQIGGFNNGLKLLYADNPGWLQNILRNSLPAA